MRAELYMPSAWRRHIEMGALEMRDDRTPALLSASGDCAGALVSGVTVAARASVCGK